MSSKTMELRFPVSGVSRRLGFWDGFQARRDYPTPWAVNVRPEDTLASRMRGGSRLGLTATTDDRVVRTGKLTDETGKPIITEAGAGILLDEYDAVWGPGGKVWVSSGADAPSGYTGVCLYRDRLFALKSGESAVYMSRQGDYTDWDCGADVEDTGRAFVFQLSEAGETGADAVALVPHKDTYLLAATADSLWVVHGDPVADGTLRNVSRDVGILSSTAWCKTGDTVFFLSKRGLYAVQADGSGLKSLSEELLPEELLDVDPDTVTILLGYRHADRGVYVFLVGDDLHWFFDLNAGGFWPFVLQSDHEPTEVYQAGAELVLICDDGTARMIGGDDDDGTDIESHVLVGPVRLSLGTDVAVLAEIEGALSESSGDVTWRIIVGDSAEEVAANGKTAVASYLAGNTATAEAYARYSGSFSAGRSRRFHPRLRGQWFVVWLQSTEKWAYEWIALRAVESGRYR